MEGPHLKISISDNGVGMTNEQISNLFQISPNGHSSGTNEEKGSGMGLLVSRDLLQEIDGNISVSSIVNEGSTFEILLKAKNY